MIDIKLLEQLCLCNGISGDEGNVRNLIINEIKDCADDIKTDNLGNLIVFKKGKKSAKSKLMVSAHMDEVGLMVTDITSDGYLKFDEVGGIDRRVLPGKRVCVGRNGLNGVIGVKPIHLTNGDEKTAVPKMSDMYIDIGVESREDALKYVNYGDSINFEGDFKINGKTVVTKALDDRFGCYVLINLIKSEPEYDMYFTFVVQEEVGLRGARPAAFTVNPDFALVIESTTAADVAEVDASHQVCNLSKGATVTVMDRATVYDKEMISAAFELAEKNNIAVQYKRAVAGGNDSGAIHHSRGGVRTLAVSLPSRYIHAPSTAANLDDCESVLKLAKVLSDYIAGGNLAKGKTV